MFDEVKKSIQWGQETLTLETGKVARQADGTVIATLGQCILKTSAPKSYKLQGFIYVNSHSNNYKSI